MLIFTQSSGQTKAFEGGVLIGATNYLGDIGKGDGPGRPFIADLQWRFTKPGISGFVRYNFSPILSARLNLIASSVQASDQHNTTYFGRVIRNAHFKSPIYEISVQGELNFFRKSLQFNPNNGFDKGIRTTKKRKKARKCPTPGSGALVSEVVIFGFGGIGGFHFNPKAYYQGQWHNLQPLGTEGQNIPNTGKEPYKLYGVVLPMGIGAKYFSARTRLKFGFEIGWRMTFTDYLDDISTVFADPEQVEEYGGEVAGGIAHRTAEVTSNEDAFLYSQPGMRRGNPNSNDSYFFTGVTIGYVFTNWTIIAPKYKRSRFSLFGN